MDDHPNGSLIWEIRCPEGGTAGSEFARATLAGDVRSVLVHAPPSTVDVEVHRPDHGSLARATGLTTDRSTPMARLTIDGDAIVRDQIWPGDDDLGSIVILPGGEAGELLAWWHADDRRSWRWRVELIGGM